MATGHGYQVPADGLRKRKRPPPPETQAVRLGNLGDSRCTCTHRYPHHDPAGGCTRCACRGFELALTPVTRTPTGPACDSCGQELLITRPDRTSCERCRLGRTPTPIPTPTPPPDLREVCAGCGRLTALADGHCLTCRHAAHR
jgi:hypothetical protein